MHSSKILLFGEYSILLNSDALAIPYSKFSGELVFEGKSLAAQLSNQRLAELLSHFSNTQTKNQLSYAFDFESLGNDITNGMYFKSDIPEGSGLGSSGALIAALFSKYTIEDTSGADISLIRKDLAILESFFHGRSSGIDPLVSFLKSPLLIRRGSISMPELYHAEKLLRKFGFFIVKFPDAGNTEGLVKQFETRCKTDIKYLNYLKFNYLPVNNKCIEIFTGNGTEGDFFSSVKELSILQLHLFAEMIPEKRVPLVKYGIENDLFSLKLCGSGGGGYFLGFTNKTGETEKYFKEIDYEIIFF